MSRPTDKTWTVLELIRWTTSFFQSKGIDSARLDAELLLASVLGMDRMGLYINFDRPVSPEERGAYRDLVKTRARRVPVKYMLGECEFMSIAFEIGPGVLIPRPETEHLVERTLEILGDQPRVVLDLGTGSGCIAVAIAKSAPNVRVFASDISPSALAIAQRNARRHDLADRVSFVAALWLDAYSHKLAVDVVVSNPPYVPESEWGTLEPEITQHEPRGALVAGADGLDDIRCLVADAPNHLRPGGTLLCEIGDGQSQAVAELVQATGRYEAPTFIQDLARIDRVLEARVKSP